MTDGLSKRQRALQNRWAAKRRSAAPDIQNISPVNKQQITADIPLTFDRVQLEDQDIIDVRLFIINHGSADILKTLRSEYKDECSSYISTYGIYAFIPCYQKGLMKLTDSRAIQWNILSIDTKTHSGSIQLKEYLVTDDKTCRPGLESVYELSDRGVSSKTPNELFEMFFLLCTIVNTKLLTDKPRARLKAVKPGRTVTFEKSDAKASERIIRSIGTILLKSVKVPKSPSERTVMHYRVTAWPVRGGVRHMKDGRLIYFKPSVHHRQGLKEEHTITRVTWDILNDNEISYEEPWYIAKNTATGVTSQGKTPEEARCNLVEALRLYFEDTLL